MAVVYDTIMSKLRASFLTKVEAIALKAHILREDNPHTVTKSQVGLANVRNVDQIQREAKDNGYSGVLHDIATGAAYDFWIENGDMKWYPKS